MEGLVKVEHLSKAFPFSRSIKEVILRKKERGIRAVDNISFAIPRGESLGVVGESGCGKTTLAKMLVRLYPPTSGKILFEDKDVSGLKGGYLKDYRKKAQMIFQNPYTAINPRFTVYDFILEPLKIHNIGKDERARREIVLEMLDKVNLNPPEKFLTKYGHQLSGGERQRAVIARALILGPMFITADEPASMLDVSLRAGILRLMEQLTDELNLTVMYISHDLSLIKYLCRVTMIMYLGKIVEMGDIAEVISEPLHPYTKALVAAVPVPDPTHDYQKVNIKGVVPTLHQDPLPGCIFADRCPYTKPICKKGPPPRLETGNKRIVYCHLYQGGV